jgi:hypothetical protein
MDPPVDTYIPIIQKKDYNNRLYWDYQYDSWFEMLGMTNHDLAELARRRGGINNDVIKAIEIWGPVLYKIDSEPRDEDERFLLGDGKYVDNIPSHILRKLYDYSTYRYYQEMDSYQNVSLVVNPSEIQTKQKSLCQSLTCKNKITTMEMIESIIKDPLISREEKKQYEYCKSSKNLCLDATSRFISSLSMDDYEHISNTDKSNCLFIAVVRYLYLAKRLAIESGKGSSFTYLKGQYYFPHFKDNWSVTQKYKVNVPIESHTNANKLREDCIKWMKNNRNYVLLSGLTLEMEVVKTFLEDNQIISAEDRDDFLGTLLREASKFHNVMKTLSQFNNVEKVKYIINDDNDNQRFNNYKKSLIGRIFNKYMEIMKMSKTYGGIIELYALSYILGVSILVAQENSIYGNNYQINTGISNVNSDKYIILYHSSPEEGDSTSHIIDHFEILFPKIHLNYDELGNLIHDERKEEKQGGITLSDRTLRLVGHHKQETSQYPTRSSPINLTMPQNTFPSPGSINLRMPQNTFPSPASIKLSNPTKQLLRQQSLTTGTSGTPKIPEISMDIHNWKLEKEIIDDSDMSIIAKIVVDILGYQINRYHQSKILLVLLELLQITRDYSKISKILLYLLSDYGDILSKIHNMELIMIIINFMDMYLPLLCNNGYLDRTILLNIIFFLNNNCINTGHQYLCDRIFEIFRKSYLNSDIIDKLFRETEKGIYFPDIFINDINQLFYDPDNNIYEHLKIWEATVNDTSKHKQLVRTYIETILLPNFVEIVNIIGTDNLLGINDKEINFSVLLNNLERIQDIITVEVNYNPSTKNYDNIERLINIIKLLVSNYEDYIGNKKFIADVNNEIVQLGGYDIISNSKIIDIMRNVSMKHNRSATTAITPTPVSASASASAATPASSSTAATVSTASAATPASSSTAATVSTASAATPESSSTATTASSDATPASTATPVSTSAASSATPVSTSAASTATPVSTSAASTSASTASNSAATPAPASASTSTATPASASASASTASASTSTATSASASTASASTSTATPASASSNSDHPFGSSKPYVPRATLDVKDSYTSESSV